MRTITRKTNVRQHNRNTKNKVADVRKHQRTVTKRLGGYIPLKDLTYPQAKKRFPFINPNADYDGDKVVNKKDCRPFDEEMQDADGPVAGFKIHREVPSHKLRDDKQFDKSQRMKPFKAQPGDIPHEKGGPKLSGWLLSQIIEENKMKSKAYDYLDEDFD